MVKYETKHVTLYRPYELPALMAKAKEGNFGEAEAKDWDSALDDCTKQGYKIINSGIFVSGGDATFWAILEKS
jgi:hypothetical protein